MRFLVSLNGKSEHHLSVSHYLLLTYMVNMRSENSYLKGSWTIECPGVCKWWPLFCLFLWVPWKNFNLQTFHFLLVASGSLVRCDDPGIKFSLISLGPHSARRLSQKLLCDLYLLHFSKQEMQSEGARVACQFWTLCQKVWLSSQGLTQLALQGT